MEIIQWKNNPISAINGIAEIKVEPNEIADIESMVKLIDGDSVGFFGVNAKLIGYIKEETLFTFGFPNITELKKLPRIYHCHVSRD